MTLPLFTRQVDDPAAHTPTPYDAHASVVNQLMDEVEPIAANTFHPRYASVQALVGDKTLTNADLPIQTLDPNGANRIVKLPASSSSNHAFLITNGGSSAYMLRIQSNAGTVTYGILGPGDSILASPDGNGNYKFGGIPSISTLLRNYLYNPTLKYAQRQVPETLTSINDDAYSADRWYGLSQTASVQHARTAGDTDSIYAWQLKQNQVAAQRMGIAQILPADDSIPLRGKLVTFSMKLKSSATPNIRMALLEWTGAADLVTSDVINDWTSGAYTAGNFFLGVNLTVAAVSAGIAAGGSFTQMSISAIISNSCNNLIVIWWTEGTVAQNVTCDFTKPIVNQGIFIMQWFMPPDSEILQECQRFYWKTFLQNIAPAQNVGAATGEFRMPVTVAGANVNRGAKALFPVPMFNAAPTITLFNPQAANNQMRDITGAADCSVTTIGNISEQGFSLLATGNAITVVGNVLGVHITAEAEL